MVLYARGNRDDWCIRLDDGGESLVFTSVHGERAAPTKYDRFLDEPGIYLNHDGEGYVFFPSGILNTKSDPSFTVIGAVAAHWCGDSDQIWRASGEQYVLHWRFNLVPIGMPLSQQADKHPQPTGGIPEEVLLEIMSMAVDLITLVVK